MYCVDPNCDEPIMLINAQIGYDGEGGPYIDGSLFQQELLQLDGMGKKRIQVWICSPGGLVMDGYNICNAILKSKTPVDTYNTGVAASIAAVIFMMGRKRIMADYACMMVHPPSGGEDKKQMDALSGSIVTMLAAKSSISATDVKYLMDRTTWLDSAECFEKGFCTEIEVTSESNKKRMQSTQVTAMWRESNLIVNNALHINTSNMTKITMKLGLNDAATEDNVIAEIKKIEDRAYQAETKVIATENSLTDITNVSKKDKADMQKKCDELQAKMDECMKECKELQKQCDAMVADKKAAENAMVEEKAKNMVTGFAKLGRIKNEASVILKWTNLAKVDFDGTKAMIEEIPLNKDAKIIPIESKLAEGELPTTAMALAVKNKLKREGKILA